MWHKSSFIAGIFLGVVILIFGLIMIIAKDWVWSSFLLFYSYLGIQAEQSRFWGMLINTIGFTISTLGLFLILKTIQRRRSSR